MSLKDQYFFLGQGWLAIGCISNHPFAWIMSIGFGMAFLVYSFIER